MKFGFNQSSGFWRRCLKMLTYNTHTHIWTTEAYLYYKLTNGPKGSGELKTTVHPVKTQISLGICPVCSESLLGAQWVAKDPSFLHADSEDSDQTGLMSKLIQVSAGRTCHFVSFVMRWFNYITKNLTLLYFETPSTLAN